MTTDTESTIAELYHTHFGAEPLKTPSSALTDTAPIAILARTAANFRW